MFFVIDKSKIFSYAIAICTVVILFVAASNLGKNDDINVVVTSSNSINTNNVITNTMSNVISNNFSGVNETNKLVGNYE